MSCYASVKSEEMRRRNISKFLDGLVEDEINDGNNDEKPTIPDYIYTPTKKIQVESSLSTKRLPKSELAAYKGNLGLLDANLSNVLKIPFSIHNIKHNDDLVRIYTGIPVAKGFFNLAKKFNKSGMKYHMGWIVGQLTMKQQLLMTLMKLKLGMDDIHLSHRFNCSLETVTNTVLTWLFALHEKLFCPLVNYLAERWSLDTPVFVDTMNVYADTPDNPHLPHKTPLEPYMGVLVARSDGIVLHACDLCFWVNDKLDVIEGCDFFCSLEPGSVIALQSDVCGYVEVPDGVSTVPFDDGDGKLLTSRWELEKRLMEFHALRRMPVEIVEHANVVWQVVVALNNFCKLKAFET